MKLLLTLTTLANGVPYGFYGREPVLNCNQICPMNYEPVCGTDGNMYGNYCILENVECETHGTVSYLYDGECYDECPQYDDCEYG